MSHRLLPFRTAGGMRHLARSLRWLARLAAFVLLGTPGVTHAFSSPDVFEISAIQGGGGERYFTGSPLDGYGCSVCHSGGPAPQVLVDGLPLAEGFQPGLTYAIEVRWTNPETPQAYHIEIIDRTGRAPAVELPPDDQVVPEARCDQDPTGSPAATLVEVNENRRVIAVRYCGSRLVQFLFTPGDVPDLSFSMSGVVSDQSEDATGDGTVTITRVVNQSGNVAVATGETSCSAAPGGRANALWGWALALAAAWLGRRRLRVR